MQPQTPEIKTIVWWILWFAITSGLVVIYLFMSGPTAGGSPQLKYLPLLPLSFAIFIRWVLLPRVTEKEKALPLFLVGLALSEGCGILGIFLAPELRQTYFLLALIGLFQYMPLFASRFGK